MHKISAVIIARDEEANIERCLRSLQWVADVLLVDSGSQDRTLEIAREFPCRIVQTEWTGYARTRQIGVDAARENWVLWIDADEEVSGALREEIRALPEEPDFDAFDIPRRTYFLGKWVRHSGWYPGRVKRLFRRDKARLNDRVLHEDIELMDAGMIGHLASDLFHFSYPTVQKYFDKMTVYGLAGAEELVRRGTRFQVHQLLLHPFWSFFRLYILSRGYLDGMIGLLVGVGSAFSTFVKYANFYQLTRNREP